MQPFRKDKYKKYPSLWLLHAHTCTIMIVDPSSWKWTNLKPNDRYIYEHGKATSLDIVFLRISFLNDWSSLYWQFIVLACSYPVSTGESGRFLHSSQGAHYSIPGRWEWKIKRASLRVIGSGRGMGRGTGGKIRRSTVSPGLSSWGQLFPNFSFPEQGRNRQRQTSSYQGNHGSSMCYLDNSPSAWDWHTFPVCVCANLVYVL